MSGIAGADSHAERTHMRSIFQSAEVVSTVVTRKKPARSAPIRKQPNPGRSHRKKNEE